MEAVVGGFEVDGAQVAATVTMGDRRHTISYVASKGPVSGTADPFLAAVLVPAMMAGYDVRIDGPVSARLLASVPEIQRTLLRFDRKSWHLPSLPT